MWTRNQPIKRWRAIADTLQYGPIFRTSPSFIKRIHNRGLLSDLTTAGVSWVRSTTNSQRGKVGPRLAVSSDFLERYIGFKSFSEIWASANPRQHTKPLFLFLNLHASLSGNLVEEFIQTNTLKREGDLFGIISGCHGKVQSTYE